MCRGPTSGDGERVFEETYSDERVVSLSWCKLKDEELDIASPSARSKQQLHDDGPMVIGGDRCPFAGGKQRVSASGYSLRVSSQHIARPTAQRSEERTRKLVSSDSVRKLQQAAMTVGHAVIATKPARQSVEVDAIRTSESKQSSSSDEALVVLPQLVSGTIEASVPSLASDAPASSGVFDNSANEMKRHGSGTKYKMTTLDSPAHRPPKMSESLSGDGDSTATDDASVQRSHGTASQFICCVHLCAVMNLNYCFSAQVPVTTAARSNRTKICKIW